jgi:hypothetical protein
MTVHRQNFIGGVRFGFGSENTPVRPKTTANHGLIIEYAHALGQGAKSGVSRE